MVFIIGLIFGFMFLFIGPRKDRCSSSSSSSSSSFLFIV